MKTVLILAALVALALAGTVPPKQTVELKSVDAEFVAKQKKVLSFFENVGEVNPEAEHYKIGKQFDIEKNADWYTNKKAFEEFLVVYKEGFMPKFEVFSIFYDRMRQEAIALFNLFYFAKDFETFYKTAAWAHVHFNEYQFIYSFYIAVLLRPDCRGLVVPAPYEVYPEFFTNSETIYKAYRLQMQDGIREPETAKFFGVEKEGDNFILYANYSAHWTYDDEEMRLAYFTEDVGLNAYYYYFHSYFPFWMEGDSYGIFKERRGERYFFFYQQLLARYYLERLANGLGEIEDFSWYQPVKKGYSPLMSTSVYPFIQRNEYYYMQTQQNIEDIKFLDSYEKTFQQYLQRGHFKAFEQEVDFHSSKAINFVGNFWQTNKDLYEKSPRNFQRSYEAIARHLLSAAPRPVDDHTVAPTALEFYQTSLRDPVFYQLYSKIIKYFLQYKEYLEPYTQENLHFVGVKVNDVKVDKLVTFFDFFEYDATNAIYRNVQEMKQDNHKIKIRQPRLNHKPFNVEIDVKSDVATDAVFKIFMGPKYDHHGYPIILEDNWMNFVELDWFKQKLTPGQNKITRASEDFFWYKQDSVPVTEIYEYLKQNKVPLDMSEDYEVFPNRLMLPKGLEGGFPYQFYVFVYPYQAPGKDYERPEFSLLVDSKTFGYPLDRPVSEYHFIQPNMFFKDVEIYFEGERFPYSLNNPFFFKNEVPKH